MACFSDTVVCRWAFELIIWILHVLLFWLVLLQLHASLGSRMFYSDLACVIRLLYVSFYSRACQLCFAYVILQLRVSVCFSMCHFAIVRVSFCYCMRDFYLASVILLLNMSFCFCMSHFFIAWVISISRVLFCSCMCQFSSYMCYLASLRLVLPAFGSYINVH